MTISEFEKHPFWKNIEREAKDLYQDSGGDSWESLTDDQRLVFLKLADGVIKRWAV